MSSTFCIAHFLAKRILPSAHLLAVSQYTVEAVADLARVAYGIEI